MSKHEIDYCALSQDAHIHTNWPSELRQIKTVKGLVRKIVTGLTALKTFSWRLGFLWEVDANRRNLGSHTVGGKRKPY
jgi:hypothetical protein